MKNKVLISQLYIENFKTVDRALISFENQDITILDGPNGFGKTTIFDSIELVLTGQIRRIQKYKIAVNSRGYKDYLFAKNQQKEVIIKIVLNYEEKGKLISKIFARRIDPTKLRPTSKKPFDFNYEIHELKFIDQNLDKETLTTENELVKLFGVSDFQDRYGLYHYVEQDDSSVFLKKNEKERMEVISKLFNIQEEFDEKIKIESTRKLLRKEVRDIGKSLEQIKGFTGDQENSGKSLEETPYFRLLPDKLNKVWDHEILESLDKNKKDTYLYELNQIKLFKENFNDFLKERKNTRISSIIKNRDRVSGLIILGYFHKEYQQLKKEYDDKHNLKSYLKILEERRLFTNYIDWDLIFNLFSIPIEQKILNDRIENIKIMNKTSNNLSEILKKFLTARENLKNQFKVLIEGYNNSDEITSSCPYCGKDYVNFENLEKELDKKTKELQKDLDENTSRAVLETNELYNSIIAGIIKLIQDYLLDENLIQDDFFRQLEKYHKLNIDVVKGNELFNNFGIDFKEYINEDKILVKDLEERTHRLINELESRREVTNQIVKELYNDFQNIYTNMFLNDKKLIINLNVEEIERKKQYIDYQFFKQSSHYFREQKILTSRLAKAQRLCEYLDKVILVYNRKINEHRGKMISDIEIPFYIYSGKIIQNHQRGIGVFLKEEKNDKEENSELKAINFVPPEETDHDIVHSFSSGQLSATVLSFTLALNKVYSQSGLNTILIDDPVQTMDEINMASFVELLRNDFNDRQLILSTHEDNISLFVRYKFSKYGLKAANVNVKEKFSK